MAFLPLNKGKNRLGIKKGLKIAILTLFLASFLFNVAFADVLGLVIDNFDNYLVGSYLPNQGGWSGDSGTWQVDNSGCHSGKCIKFIKLSPQGTYFYMEHLGQIEITDEGKQDFYLKPITSGKYQEMYIYFRDKDGNDRFGLRLFLDYYLQWQLNWRGGGSYLLTSYLNSGTWYKITFEWSVSGNYVKYYLNDNLITTYNSLPAGIYKIQIRNWNDYSNPPSEPWVYLDDFSGNLLTISAEPSSYYLNWNLEIPTSCQYPQNSYQQVSSTTNFEVKGSFSVPNNTPYIWRYLRLNFINETGEQYKIKIFDFDLPNVKANQTYNFDYFLDISSVLSTSTDLVSFSIEAYGFSEEGEFQGDEFPQGCKIYLGLGAIPPFLVPQVEECPSQPELEDCSQYNIPERWICEIKNALKSIFLPTCEKLMELKRTMDLFKQKFPFNYINLFTNFYQDINNGINETSTIQFKILGQSGNVDLAFWENQATIGGITQTFSHIIYNIFLFLFLFIFVLWLISYLKRIF